MPKNQSLTNDEWVIICTIHQEPKYRFLQEEFARAKKLEQRGLIQSIGNKMFSVTKLGEELYKKANDEGHIS